VIALGASSLLLVVLCRQSDALKGVRFIPARALALPLALAGGLLTSGISLSLIRVVTSHAGAPRTSGTDGPIFSAITCVVFALAVSIGEECFFRGWLQSAISRELGPTARHWTVLFSAFGFTATHLGSLILPWFLVGLVAGGLYAWSGGLLAPIVARAVHNAVLRGSPEARKFVSLAG
jgi:membrane protease YdiL (CAAX protease family)